MSALDEPRVYPSQSFLHITLGTPFAFVTEGWIPMKIPGLPSAESSCSLVEPISFEVLFQAGATKVVPRPPKLPTLRHTSSARVRNWDSQAAQSVPRSLQRE